MSLLSTAAIAFIGTVFWLASPEAATLLAGAQHRWPVPLIGLVAGASQSVALIGLYFFGEELRRRSRWFDRQCARARSNTRLGREGYATGAVVSAALFGFPPVSVTAALLPGVAPRPGRLLPTMLILRLLRFTALAWAGAVFGGRLPWPGSLDGVWRPW
jgi:membrane protein YqaA with SNARE-associated domain